MINCKICKNKKHCLYAGEDRELDECKDYSPKTNSDAIRMMTDEELARFIEDACCPPTCYSKHVGECSGDDCVPCWLAWLKSEVKL